MGRGSQPNLVALVRLTQLESRHDSCHWAPQRFPLAVLGALTAVTNEDRRSASCMQYVRAPCEFQLHRQSMASSPQNTQEKWLYTIFCPLWLLQISRTQLLTGEHQTPLPAPLPLLPPANCCNRHVRKPKKYQSVVVLLLQESKLGESAEREGDDHGHKWQPAAQRCLWFC